MKRLAALILCCVLMSGCSDESCGLEVGMELRSRLLKADKISFQADISADHGDTVDQFSVECITDQTGSLSFTVTAPDTISGITGQIAQKTGALTFDDTLLYFPLMTQDCFSPVSAPWILMNTLRSGYLRSAGTDAELLQLTFNDSYDENALQVDIWLDEKNLPKRTEVLCDGQLILSLDVSNFEIL